MSKSCCEKSQCRTSQGSCKGSGECCSIIWGDKAKEYNEEGATCVINCKNIENCCNNGLGCTIKCKGKNGTECEINCGCCSIVVEKTRDHMGNNCCKLTYCEEKSGQNKSTLSCCLKEDGKDEKYCIVKCGDEICCVIKG